MIICIFLFDNDEPTQWRFIKSIRAHFKPIVDIQFVPSNESRNKNNRLISVGEDRYLVEYDLNNL